MGRVQRKPLPALAAFQVPTVQNNQHAKGWRVLLSFIVKTGKSKKKSYLLRFFINNFHVSYREWPPDETETDGDLPPLGFLHKCRSFRFKDIGSVLPSPLTRSGEARSPWPGRGHGRADVASPAAPPCTGNLPLGTPFPFCQKITSTGQVVTRIYQPTH